MARSREKLRRWGLLLTLTATALLLACGLSLFGWFGWTGSSVSLCFGNAGIGIGTGDYRGASGGFGAPGWTLERFDKTFNHDQLNHLWGGVNHERWRGESVSLSVPVWPLIPVLGTVGLILLYRTRHLPNHCPHCRYNLTGLPPNSPCPECGNASRTEART